MKGNRVRGLRAQLPWKGPREVDTAGIYVQVDVGRGAGRLGPGPSPRSEGSRPDPAEDASWGGLQGAPGALESEESSAQLRFGS